MKESTKKSLAAVAECMAAAELTLTPAGFVYHSERTWVGLTTTGDTVVVSVNKDAAVPPDVRLCRAEATEVFTGEKKPTPKGAKKKNGG